MCLILNFFKSFRGEKVSVAIRNHWLFTHASGKIAKIDIAINTPCRTYSNYRRDQGKWFCPSSLSTSKIYRLRKSEVSARLIFRKKTRDMLHTV